MWRATRDFYQQAAQGFQQTDVHAVLEDVLRLTNNQLEKGKVTVERQWAADLPAIEANPAHLKQIFLNLVLNAVDAMPGSGRLGMRTERDEIRGRDGQPGQPAVRIEISDSGVGMSTDALFALVRAVLHDERSWVGPGSVDQLRTHHGPQWQITVSSQMGQGTTFTLLFPVTQPPDTFPHEGMAATMLKGANTSIPPARILVVDDDASIRFYLEETLRRDGHQVEPFESGEAALEAIGAREFDLALIDLKLRGIGRPEGAGRAAPAVARHDRDHAHSPRVAGNGGRGAAPGSARLLVQAEQDRRIPRERAHRSAQAPAGPPAARAPGAGGAADARPARRAAAAGAGGRRLVGASRRRPAPLQRGAFSVDYERHLITLDDKPLD